MDLPWMAEIEEIFIRNSKIWAEIVRNKERQNFISRMEKIKEKLPRVDPEFGSSYSEMYSLLDEKR